MALAFFFRVVFSAFVICLSFLKAAHHSRTSPFSSRFLEIDTETHTHILKRDLERTIKVYFWGVFETIVHILKFCIPAFGLLFAVTLGGQLPLSSFRAEASAVFSRRS